MGRLDRALGLIRDLLTEFLRPGSTGVSGRALWLGGRIVIGALLAITNAIGAVAVVFIALLVIPYPALRDPSHVRLLDGGLAAGYLVFAVAAGSAVGTRGLRGLRAWLVEERPAEFTEVRRLLRAPLFLFGVQVALWLGGAVVFGAVDATFSATLGLRVGIAVAATGVITAACAYLLTELLLRPAAARALAQGAPRRLVVPGVATRLVLAWLLGNGVQLVGLVAIGVLAVSRDGSLVNHPRDGVVKLGVAMIVLGGSGLLVGLFVVFGVARTTADPVESVRRALAEVQRGNLDVRVPVYDGTQIGQLQLGFNEMVDGLRERERIREAFGTYVDPDVAERVLEEGIDLAGEELEVTVMFVDIRDFTGFAERTPADRVVAALNELFAQFVTIVVAEGGRVDKFVGDGLLAVFGAPRRRPDHADRALAAALRIVAEARSSYGLRFGIGLNSGRVVAGNVGGAGRLEFSVIGDPVNVAARVEAATRRTGDPILIAQDTVRLLRAPHPPLHERHDVELRGKTAPVRLFAPELDR